MAAPSFETLTYAVEDGVAVVTLNRPEKLNAYSAQMRIDLSAALRRAEADDAVRVVILTGAGRSFCAGLDLKEAGTTVDPLPKRPVIRDLVTDTAPEDEKLR